MSNKNIRPQPLDGNEKMKTTVKKYIQLFKLGLASGATWQIYRRIYRRQIYTLPHTLIRLLRLRLTDISGSCTVTEYPTVFVNLKLVIDGRLHYETLLLMLTSLFQFEFAVTLTLARSWINQATNRTNLVNISFQVTCVLYRCVQIRVKETAPAELGLKNRDDRPKYAVIFLPPSWWLHVALLNLGFEFSFQLPEDACTVCERFISIDRPLFAY